MRPGPARGSPGGGASRPGRSGSASTALDRLAARIVRCRRCPRLVAHREAVARTRRAAYRYWTYWGRAVPGFGDPRARLVVVGLAPAAHGANRTGRMFTGDRSGDWLYRALHASGFANQPSSSHRGDGLELRDAYVTAAVRCAPPANRPTPEERRRCLPYLAAEFRLLDRTRVVLALGAVALDACLAARRALGRRVPSRRPRFRHGGEIDLGDVVLLTSYHPSQRNTQTGLLTWPMFDAVFARARRLLVSADG